MHLLTSKQAREYKKHFPFYSILGKFDVKYNGRWKQLKIVSDLKFEKCFERFLTMDFKAI